MSSIRLPDILTFAHLIMDTYVNAHTLDHLCLSACTYTQLCVLILILRNTHLWEGKMMGV